MDLWSAALRSGKSCDGCHWVWRRLAGSNGNCAMSTFQERRQFRRMPYRASVTVSVPARGQSLQANVLNISKEGVILLCAEPVFENEDALLAFRTTSRTGVRTEEIWSRVIHSRFDDDAWVVGLKFSELLDRRRTPSLARAAAIRERKN
jgi:hypothetical protein